jgi:hypothetical protein
LAKILSEERPKQIALELQIGFTSLWGRGICVDARRALMERWSGVGRLAYWGPCFAYQFECQFVIEFEFVVGFEAEELGSAG